MREELKSISFSSVSDLDSFINKMAILYSQQFQSDKVDVVKLLHWKYVNNPFGKSEGLLIENVNGELVTMRMFTPWKLKLNENSFQMLQPSDSATHNDYKGQGYFTRLTSESLESFSYDGIFNFPNRNSINIYKKLGFVQEEELMPFFRIIPFSRLFFKTNHVKVNKCHINDIHKILLEKSESIVSTDWNVDALIWRFIDRPSSSYYVFIDNSCFVIYRLNSDNPKRVDVILTSPKFTNSDYKRFVDFLAMTGIVVLKYFGLNTDFFHQISRDNLSFRKGNMLNFVSFGWCPDLSNENVRIELAETDFI
ncbi:GNAT family N-acetyltransferase [Vibrio parahaemolyticus]|uniref:GNAT family N-acetyltransferase n=1 Tax=Vibrio parahaemolyticus TaxID=670 RepID=UPI0011227F96|nr:GNAT family N-acetyltransferase [Vibrio parahaemolyticus]EII3114853.1 GNAT family N-acetyltransferase [Vibrio parahaemolyticus]EJC7006562.1 GNAT family N-acetyltransferase [Vibrio parahaemolyticus]EJC7025296.1 GNAT family N-acetyltransferase [Vibrio parahaemolyticus]EJC7174835.1 GNAT family N-acetyltransferase [Vibrio parahaemolyticus]EJF4097135.1 GNAT family N-acetyltransferase [Vibrio parahaemolyticus]